MLKKALSTFLLGTTSLCLLNPQIALAEPTETFQIAKKFYPDTCVIKLEGKLYYCDSLVMGSFRNGNGNLQLCDESTQNCFILIMGLNQANKIINDQPFSIRNFAWSKNNSILKRFQGNLNCQLTTEGMGCAGYLSNGTAITIYTN